MWQAPPQEELLQLFHVGHDGIILNLDMRGEGERNRMFLASLRKKADIIYHLKRKSIVLGFIKKILYHVYFQVIFFYFEVFCLICIMKLIRNFSLNDHSLLLLYEQNMYI